MSAPPVVLVSGSHGLLASALLPLLERRGYRVVRLVRPPMTAGPGRVAWDPAAGAIDRAALEAAGSDAVVHLAGERIGALRWTAAKRERIHTSRVAATRLLAETLATLSRRPRVLLCGSAVGYYGDRSNEDLTEESGPGGTFLSRLARDWEAAAAPAHAAGIRVVLLRSGNVLSGAGGFLRPLLPLFRLGLGGRLGDGRQYFPWIGIDDWVEAVWWALSTNGVTGPVNLVAPQTVTNATFTRTLARVLRRPAIFTAPAFALRLVMGEFAADLLASARVQPARLLAAGFAFRHPVLEDALRHVLGRMTTR